MLLADWIKALPTAVLTRIVADNSQRWSTIWRLADEELAYRQAEAKALAA